MAYFHRQADSAENKKEELVRTIERSVERLSLQELESLYYDMLTKGYVSHG